MANRPNAGTETGPEGRNGAAGRITVALIALCAALLAADFLYHRHGYLAIEEIAGFYPGVGLLAGAALLIVASALRLVLKRAEDYYAPKAVESEPYPEDQIERADADA